MHTRLQQLICLMVLMFTFVGSAGAATIAIRSDNWPPFNGDPGEVKAGYMIEVLKEIYAATGHRIDYRLMSWDESLAAVRKGSFNAVVEFFRGSPG